MWELLWSQYLSSASFTKSRDHMNRATADTLCPGAPSATLPPLLRKGVGRTMASPSPAQAYGWPCPGSQSRGPRIPAYVAPPSIIRVAAELFALKFVPRICFDQIR